MSIQSPSYTAQQDQHSSIIDNQPLTESSTYPLNYPSSSSSPTSSPTEFHTHMSEFPLPLTDDMNLVGMHDLVGMDMGMEDLGSSLSPRLLGGGGRGGGGSTGDSSGNPYSNGEEEEEFEKLQADYTNVGDGDGDDEDNNGGIGLGIGGVAAAAAAAATTTSTSTSTGPMGMTGGLRSFEDAVRESKEIKLELGGPSGSRNQHKGRVASVSNGKKRARMGECVFRYSEVFITDSRGLFFC
jgi:hypothetical protein